MRFDIAMADVEGVDVEQSSEGLVGVELDLKGREGLAMGADVGVKIALIVLHYDVQVLTP